MKNQLFIKNIDQSIESVNEQARKYASDTNSNLIEYDGKYYGAELGEFSGHKFKFTATNENGNPVCRTQLFK